eukprot:811534-Pelagomonas_calceolata.AAC.1
MSAASHLCHSIHGFLGSPPLLTTIHERSLGVPLTFYTKCADREFDPGISRSLPSRFGCHGKMLGTAGGGVSGAAERGFVSFWPEVWMLSQSDVVPQVEACDVLEGFLLLQSMAGGTGAGLGTYVATALRDEYPATHALNCCVWPYESGEVIVQVRLCTRACEGSE